MSPSPNDSNAPAESGASTRKSSLRSLLVLVVAASALLAFIVSVGDFRRKQNAIAQMDWHCGTYTSRMGETEMLPLNFEPDIATTRRIRMLKVFWVSREDARALRGSTGRIIVAYTGAIPRVLGAHGRAVAYFEDGSFGGEWLAQDEFDDRWQKQQDAVRKLNEASKTQSTTEG